MIRHITSVRCFVFMLLICSSVTTEAQECSDKEATTETKNLYKNLFNLSKTQTLFGHQDDMAYGVKWRYRQGKSDVKSVAGQYPAVFGWDLGHLELGKDKNLDGVPFAAMKEYIIRGYEMGTVITVSWHLNNPLTGGSSWDTTHHTVASVLKGGAKHELYKSWLDKVAAFMEGLKGKNGEYIPVLFRPFHEYTGNWFWWCQNACSAQEFISLWRFTVDYLRTEKKLHHLLYVFNTAEITSGEEFLSRYPGDDVVDVISVDTYQHGPRETREMYIKKVQNFLSVLHPVARQRNKILAFAETGYEAIPERSWWTQSLLPAIEGYPVAWVLVWRNHGFMPSTNKMHYYAPYPKQISAADFKKFSKNERMLFQKKLKKIPIYSGEK